MHGITTILRGFKVSIGVLDAFFEAYSLPATEGISQPHPDQPANKSLDYGYRQLLFAKVSKADPTADESKFRLVIPSLQSWGNSSVAFVTYAWFVTTCYRELDLDKDLPTNIPPGFEELRQEILSYLGKTPVADRIIDEGRMGVFVVRNHEVRSDRPSAAFLAFRNSPTTCHVCGEVFEPNLDANGEVTRDPQDSPPPYRRQKHLVEVHGHNGPPEPLPEC